jgi:carnitine O-acetyltransferase
MGVLSTENRKIWSSHRAALSEDRDNASCLHIVDSALFVVCLDDATPVDLADMCNTFLCGTYGLEAGIQIGTCTNRWYDKVNLVFSTSRVINC